MIAEAVVVEDRVAAESPETSPFKFLDYFADSPRDRRRFGGRDREIRELVAGITNERTLVLYGPSGIGKTSLLLAGVFPALRERGVRPVYVRTLVSPLADLRQALTELDPTATGEDLSVLLAGATAPGPIAIVFDQFEELFIRFRDRPEERETFIAALAGAIDDRSLDLTVVFSLREDYLAHLGEIERYLPALFEYRYRLQPLTAFGVRQAITKPLADARIPYEPAVVSKLIAQLEEVDFEPPILQILCAELYREAAKRAAGGVPRITLGDLERLGGRDGIFRRFLDSATAALPDSQHLLARMIFDALITVEGTKQAVTLPDLLGAGFTAHAGEVAETLERLASQRLVRKEERGGETWYELIHERLIQVLKEWLELDREFFEFRQARTYVHNNSASDLWLRNPDTLLGSGVLTHLLGPCRERFRFGERELEYVVRSAIYRKNEELSFWSQRFGETKTRGLVQAWLTSGDERERESAAGSAAFLADEDGKLASSCLDLALRDGSEAVRRTAGLSLARLARAEDIAALRRASRQRDTKEKAREALEALHAGGHGLRGLSWLSRKRAARRERQRVLSENASFLRRRWLTGTVTGVVAGALWSILEGLRDLGLGYGLDPSTYVAPQASDLLVWLLGLAVLGAVYGAALAWPVSFAAARQAILHQGEPGWLGSLVRMPLAILVLVLTLLAIFARTTAAVHGWQEVLALALWLGLGAAAAWLAAWSAPGLCRPGSLLGRLAKCLALSLGPPVLLALAALTLIRWAVDPFFLMGQVVTLISWVAFATFIFALSLSQAAVRQPVKAPPAASSRGGMRWALCLASLVVSVFWFDRFFGFDSVVPKIVDYELGRGLENLAWTPRRLQTDPRPFHIRNRTGKLQVVEIDTEPNRVNGLGVVLLGTNPQPVKGETMILPPGRHPAVFVPFMPAKDRKAMPGDNRGARLSLRPKAPGSRLSAQSLRLSDPYWDSWYPLEPVADRADEWKVSLAGELDLAQLPDEVQGKPLGIVVKAWCETLAARRGREWRVRALNRLGGTLPPNETPPQWPRLPALEIAKDGSVAVPLGKRVDFGLPVNFDEQGITWLVKPEQGRWSLDLRFREAPRPNSAAPPRYESSGPREVFVTWFWNVLPE